MFLPIIINQPGNKILPTRFLAGNLVSFQDKELYEAKRGVLDRTRFSVGHNIITIGIKNVAIFPYYIIKAFLCIFKPMSAVDITYIRKDQPRRVLAFGNVSCKYRFCVAVKKCQPYESEGTAKNIQRLKTGISGIVSAAVNRTD